MTARKPAAFLALWNGIASPALQPEYEAWHSFEHVPERVGLPGFIEARRYRAWAPDDQGAPLYFTCYWLDGLAALESAAYREVFATPTPWSARMRTQLRGFFRQPCNLLGSLGSSSASQLCTLRLKGVPPALPEQLSARAATAELISAQWGQAAAAEFAIPIPNSAVMAHDDVVLMLQGTDRAALARAAQGLAAAVPLAEPPAFFEFVSQVRQCDLAHPLGARQPALTPLFQSFHSFTSSAGDKP